MMRLGSVLSRLREAKGFTLIEMILAVAILSILAKPRLRHPR